MIYENPIFRGKTHKYNTKKKKKKPELEKKLHLLHLMPF